MTAPDQAGNRQTVVRDVIAAVATAAGRGGVGVVRISGPNLQRYAEAITGKTLLVRHAHYADFRDEAGVAIDQGIALYFAAPASFTGEDVLELQGHGGPVVMHMLLERCLALGARLAEPGEFSRRAFLNGKLDLAQAESVADLIDASSQQAARAAVRSLQGQFSKEIHTLVEQMVQLRMLVEATLDFPEEDIDFLEAADASGKLQRMQAQLAQVLAAATQGRLLREGMQVVLIGQPNVGKSSLLNALAGQEVAIVTEIAGTTRDTVRELIQLSGVPVHIIDTAGLRETVDQVEQIGIQRTWAAAEKADLILLLQDARVGITESELTIMQRLPAQLPRVTVLNKIDLCGQAPGRVEVDGYAQISLSARTGEGLDLLRDTLLELFGWNSHSEGVFIARARHLDAIRRAACHLDSAVNCGAMTDLLAEELRLAQLALSEITGEFSADDLLGEIFSRFCIGK